MIDKETWTIGIDLDKMEKLIKFIKSVFLKKKLSQVTVKHYTDFSYER